ncbi:MAG: MaoC family dehydratase [Acidimicrobiales bacterium]|jgi:acyl dehydratase|nr:MaoC family dehydratase [Acidimicrobiales bacterium]
MEFRFDDIDGMNAAASEEWGEFGDSIVVTQEMINQFAELTGDRQWIHIDVERAKSGPFGAPIAHGFLTLSLLPQIAKKGIVITGAKNAVNFGAEGLRFMSPVPAGSEIHGRCRLVGAAQHRAGVLVTSEWAVHVKGNEKPSLLYKMQILYQG